MNGINDLIPVVSAAALAMGTTGDKATLSVPPGKWELERSFMTIEGTDNNATAGVVKLDIRPTAGSDTNRGDGDAGVLKKTASVAQQGKLIYWLPASKVFLYGGQQVIVEVTTANGATLPFTAGMLLREAPEAVVNRTNEALTA